ncbi:radical SAM family heme chaperone HemW [Sneathiella aquimaris]|uniref:radical SAM family heme chaperone HemW n=1 Tax=Sneathiella aquimaris TaxID=2599305 RepID=UPI001469AC04|nr:radical SAM family heme chaperone HemW [Sneathiella aquimaris]
MPALQRHNRPDPGFGIYFHWPFCRKKCPYCDFNSHVRDTVDQAVWADALLTELDWFTDRSDRQTVTSIFFGGGTPSLMVPETVSRLIEGVKQRFSVANDLEISLEANPTSAEASFFHGYRAAGVTRLSMGVQSLSDDALLFLGREHSVQEALKTIELARSVFPNISFDLIYALPGQTLNAWEADLREALKLAGDHLSLYQLTIEPNTGFAGSVRRGEFSLPKDELAEAMFERTQDICADAGLPAYEISNHARPGFECRHNLTYWRYGPYLGIGPGAHGRVLHGGDRTAFEQEKKPEKWLQSVQKQRHGTKASFLVETPEEKAEELLLMGLRLSEGVWFENFEAATGQPFYDLVKKDRLEKLVKAGFLAADEKALKATDEGRFVLNAVLADLLS